MSELPFTPFLVLWAAPGGPMRAAADETEKLLVFSDDCLAELFAARLACHGFRSVTWPTNPGQVTDLLLAAGVDGEGAPDRVSLFEAQTTNQADAERWCIELADRLVNDANGPESENGRQDGTDITF